MKYFKYIYPYLKTLVFYKPFFKSSGKQVVVISPIRITARFIITGSRVMIANNARVEGVSNYEGVRYNPIIIIGDRVSIQQNLHLTCANSVKIGNNTAIAANVSITDINHGYKIIDMPPERQPLEVSEVIIGENCKIYNNAVILPGTILGKQCIIGANSVVSGIFPDYCVIAGAPARIVKKYNPATQLWEKNRYNRKLY